MQKGYSLQMNKILNQLLNSPFIKTAFEISKKYKQEFFLVGGAIRDLYINNSIGNDLDFLVESNAGSIASDFSKKYMGSFFCLDNKRGNYRAIINHQCAYHTIDFSTILDGDINRDLMNRDFTINSIALKLNDIFEKDELNLIDPVQGLEDFKKKYIRVSSATSFSQDPVRILRAVRFSRNFNFTYEPNTLNLIKEMKDHLLVSPWERIRSEFFKILNLPDATQSLLELDRLGLLSLLIPEIESMKGVEQGTHHDYDLWEHSLKAVHFAEETLENIKQYFPQYGERLKNYFSDQLESEIQRSQVLILTAFLHDIGKPLTKIERGKQIHFYHHDRFGVKINRRIAKRFMLGRKTIRMITTITRHHMRLLNLYKLETLTDRAKYRFLKDAKDAYLDTLIIGIADFMATRKSLPGEKKETSFLKFVSHLIDYYYQEFPKSRFKALLNGNEVMETLHIKPGEKVGELLALIENAEREGTISNREEAVKLITSKHRMKDRR